MIRRRTFTACTSVSGETARGLVLRVAVVVALGLAVAGCASDQDASAPTTMGREAPSPDRRADDDWTLVLEDVDVGTTGIGVVIHPTTAPVVIAADATAPLVACPADALGGATDPSGSSWGRWWTRCEDLGSDPLELPPTDGRSHVGIRVRTPDGAPAIVGRLRIGWVCADEHLVLTDIPGAAAGSRAGCGDPP